LVHIPCGVDTEAFRPTTPPLAPPFVLGFLSLLDAHHRYKGLAVLLRALAGLSDLPLRLVVGGAGEELGRYRALAIELGVAERVDFLGFVPDGALPDFFRACHLFALPSTDSRQEAFG